MELKNPFPFNVTLLGAGSSYYTVNTNTTNATGHVDFVFFANTTYTVERQNWLGFIDTSQSPSCYLYNVSNVFNVTTLSNRPVLFNQSVSPITGGWGDSRTFNVTVNDSTNNATVYFYKSDTLVGESWTYISEQNYTNGTIAQVLSFIYQSDCSDLGASGANKLWYFKFNASNTVGNVYSTTASIADNFSLARDYIYFENIVGNETVANRTGSQIDLLSLRIRDANTSIVSGLNMTFKVTRDGTNYDTGTINITNSTFRDNYFRFNSCAIIN